MSGVAAANTYPNWTLGERKFIKAAEPLVEQASQALVMKLGTGWAFSLDWEVMGKIAEGEGNRKDPGETIVKKLVQGIVQNDVNTWDAETVNAVNNVCGAGSKIKVTLGLKTATYNCDSRVQIDVVKGGINVIWSADWLGYDYGAPYIVRIVDNMSNVAVMPAIKGDWKLAEIKSYQAGKADFDQAQEMVRMKLGGTWSLVVDWQGISTVTKANRPVDVHKWLIQDHVMAMINNDINTFDADLVAAANQLVGTSASKQLVLKFGPKDANYDFDSRVSVAATMGAITVTWNYDWIGYEHGDKFIARRLLSSTGAAPMPGVPGQWTLAELKAIEAKRSEQASALVSLQAKLGSDWSLSIDWTGVDANSRGHGARSDIGDAIVCKLLGGFITNDIGAIDADVAEALNEKVASAKSVKFTLGVKTGTYDFDNRVSINVDSMSGITITWSGDWLGYDYGSNYLCKWALANC